ncbi:hypothetical protein [Microbacterium foliorum]|uniref:Uncharacterized protein n=1 Tax=Microbacterium foliorum TaxID=104336 RepID=A0A0F0KSN5_9MICO|nr:hypothetical protein [Microbacterium foliorum]KJL23140.1 hypothetical protein RN50_01078 [Microbacterium foliorum]
MMLDDGVSYAEIVRTVGGTSLGSVGRYALSRKSELARLVDDEPGVTHILSRLVELAEHANSLRRQSKLTGSPVQQIRAIKSEAEILQRILEELRVDDLGVAEALNESQALVSALKIFLTQYPDSASDLIEVFRSTPELEELATALSARTNRRTTS